MFGTLRFVLALLVVVTHVGVWVWPGVYAVFGFYVISGYLMCLVLNQRYGFGPAGLGGYCLNRFLRIYPPYWVACLLSVALIALFGEATAATLWPPWRLPETFAYWFQNLSIFALPSGIENRMVPASWALRVEVFYYLLLGLGLGRGRGIALVWLIVSLGYHVYISSIASDWGAKYFPIPAASLPFSMGACIYHYRDVIARYAPNPRGPLAVVAILWTANLVLQSSVSASLGVVRFYTNFVLIAALVALLSLPAARLPRWLALDARLGDVAYPVYLVHMQVALLIGGLGIAPAFRSHTLLLASLLPVIAVAWLLLRVVDDPVERLRSAVKRSLRTEDLVA